MADTEITWYRVPVDKGLLRELTRRSDLAGLAQSLGHLGLAAVTGYCAWFAWHHLAWPWIVLAFFCHGTVITFFPAAYHELCHGTPFRTRWLNELFLGIFCFLSWGSFVYFRTSHKRHHQYTVWKGWDLEVVLPQKVRLTDFLLYLVVHPVAAFTALQMPFRHIFGILHGEWEKRIFTEDGPARRRALVAWAWVLVAGHAALAALFIVLGDWILIPIILFPFYASWLFYLCGMPQHFGLTPGSPDWRRSCRTVLQDPVSSFLYWQMNHHTEHHMYAATPFHRLRGLHDAIAHEGPPPDHGITGAWKEMIYCARMQKKDPQWTFDPFDRKAEA